MGSHGRVVLPHLSFMKLRRSGAGQGLAKVAGSDLQELSGNGVAYTEDGAEDEGQPLFTVKAKQRLSAAQDQIVRVPWQRVMEFLFLRTAILAHQPLPRAADMQNGEVAGAERRFLDRKAAVFQIREPVRHHRGN